MARAKDTYDDTPSTPIVSCVASSTRLSYNALYETLDHRDTVRANLHLGLYAPLKVAPLESTQRSTYLRQVLILSPTWLAS